MHGSGRHSLSHYAAEIRVATYDPATGEPVIRTISDGPELRAARCSLGCLGVIVSIGIWCRPRYRVEEHFRRYPRLDDVLRAESEYPLQQFYFIPWLWQYIVQHRRESPARRSRLAGLYRAYCFLVFDVLFHLIVLLLARVVRGRRAVHFFFRSIAPRTVIRRWKVVDESQAMLVMEHELFRHIEIEVFVRESRLAASLDYVRELLSYLDGDEHALSEATRARHWGKFCPVSAAEVTALYPELHQFQEICGTWDPQGCFRNDWANRLLFASEPAQNQIAQTG